MIKYAATFYKTWYYVKLLLLSDEIQIFLPVLTLLLCSVRYAGMFLILLVL